MSNGESFFVLKNISLYAIFGVVAKSFSLLITPIIARSLSVEDFGTYIVLVSAIMLIQSVFLFGFESSLNYFFNKFKSEVNKKTLVSTQTLFILITTVISALIISLVLSDTVENINIVLTWGVLSVVAVYFATLLKVDMNVSAYIKNQVLQSVSLLCFIYLLVVAFSQSLEGIIYANIITLILSIVFTYFFIKKYLGMRFSTKLLKKVLIYGLPLMPSGALLWASMQLDRYFILYFLDDLSLGIYSFAIAIVMIPMFLKTAVKSAIDPFIMKSFHKDAVKTKKVISNYFSLNLLVFSFLFLLLSLFSHEIVLLMGGVKYLDSVPYIPWLVLITCLTTCNQYFIYGLNFSKRNAFILKGLIYMLVINVLLMFFFIRGFGINGVIAASFIANAFYTLYIYNKSNSLYQVSYQTKKNTLIVASALLLFSVNHFIFPDDYFLKFVSLFLFIAVNIRKPVISRDALHD
ncbi:oligosaccharide flippase family protein [Ferrimonas sp. YFM]|uniref:lipopolysaccharide biosynthesis protein n=1 Tax=Ferrimonas sp. YFM TaxID=3028878 RepID=UPI0025740B6E|nr:oligosaccharide flippase family protein [Ferrimonas sp. YFM]BDY04071.1 polysaccharide biosynthesis protein [Ferrimonas sp. YFM]